MPPKPARPDHVDAAEVTEAADLVGLHGTSSIDGHDWLGTRLTQSSSPAQRVRSSSARRPARVVTGINQRADWAPGRSDYRPDQRRRGSFDVTADG
ncbi:MULTISPECIES: DUF3052 family protein [unclassified Rhodococcus (in: high G+C Gram-positive bacteria)]|uniref:DUF3052 family protein n=1 Tax=unclassified Rhodococcus (in: high G+C Gram-positive bacteria) TaxID=192944 RepID=UPI002078DA9F|nr:MULTISPECIES: DUF3052 family protein [unclassified Rhodococcus (in: high G+C Gram-positive bacteria)]